MSDIAIFRYLTGV